MIAQSHNPDPTETVAASWRALCRLSGFVGIRVHLRYS
jgi:hypothetical protein